MCVFSFLSNFLFFSFLSFLRHGILSATCVQDPFGVKMLVPVLEGLGKEKGFFGF